MSSNKNGQSMVIDDDGLDLLFRKARTYSAWLDCPVDDALLHAKANMTVDQMRMAFEREGLDPIKGFSVVCRQEFFDGNLASDS